MQTVFKYLGGALGLLPIVIVGYGFFSGNVHTFFPILVPFILTNILFFAILPRMTKHAAIHDIHSGSMHVFQSINRVIVSATLVVVYVMGVGFVFLLSRLFGKRFLMLKPKKSTWIIIQPPKPIIWDRKGIA